MIYLVFNDAWNQLLGAFNQLVNATTLLDALVMQRQIKAGHVVEVPLSTYTTYEPTKTKVVYRSGI